MLSTLNKVCNMFVCQRLSLCKREELVEGVRETEEERGCECKIDSIKINFPFKVENVFDKKL